MTDELKRVIEAIRQAQQNQKPQEPPTAAQYADANTREGLEGAKAAYTQQQAEAQQAAQAQAAQEQLIKEIQAANPPQQQMMTPMQQRLMSQMVGYKDMYENADAHVKAANPKVTDDAQLNAAADSLRNTAHAGADYIRQIAKDASVDLSGIADVDYASAQRNLMTRQTKEVADILSGQGKYGRNADSYYNDQYMKLIGEGKSVREAKRIAGQMAQRYQNDRVTYLRNAYNMYGRNDNYTNEDGVAIIQEIAMEMPEVASVYANAYKLPTAAQDRVNQLEDADILFNQGLKRMGVAHGYNKELAELQGDITRRNATHMGGITRENATHQNMLDMERERQRMQMSFEDWQKKHEILKDDEEGTATRQANGYYNMVYSMVRRMGGSEEEAAEFAGMKTLARIDNFGVGKGRGTDKGKSGSNEPKYTDKQQVYMRNMKNLIVQAKADPTNTELIDQLETLFRGGDDLGVEGNKDSVKALDFPVETYQKWEDIINALRGMSYKVKADDNNAALYFSKVRDVQLLEDMYPNYNWDDYWKRRGGKPK